jgi:hypothetical protein
VISTVCAVGYWKVQAVDGATRSGWHQAQQQHWLTLTRIAVGSKLEAVTLQHLDRVYGYLHFRHYLEASVHVAQAVLSTHLTALCGQGRDHSALDVCVQMLMV